MTHPYRFRSIIDADLPMLERWLRTPEVARWWGDPAEQFALLKEDFGEPLMRQWIVEYGQRPFAYAQAYEVDQKHFRLGAQQLRRFELARLSRRSGHCAHPGGKRHV